MEIELKNIYKKYDHEVLKDFSCTFESGITTALMGKSGVGKSTLASIIIGSLKPDSGSVLYGHKPVFSVVFQENRLFGNFTVLENVVSVCNSNEKALEALTLCEAADFAHIKAKDLSGGMARRAALARAVSADAEVYIFDEPFKGIDIATQNRLLLNLKKYLLNKTCILITHNVNVAVLLAQKIIVIDKKPAQITLLCENNTDENVAHKINLKLGSD